MDAWQIIIICVVCASVLAVIAAGLTVAVIVDRTMFGVRQDKNARYKYFTAEDFNLKGESFPVYYNGGYLSGNLYFDGELDDSNTLVIFVHGFGAGSASYTTEIASLVRRGYAVLAYDAYGCNNSEGKAIRGFYSGAECAVAACIAVRRDDRLKDKNLVLVGHSWGAYSALCASAEIKVDKVVAISAFNSPIRATLDAISMVTGRHSAVFNAFLYPWFALINMLKFGVKGNSKSAKVAEKSGAEILVIHGKRDKTVPVKNSAAVAVRGLNFSVLMFDDKGHNPYNTINAEKILSTLLTTHFADEKSMTEFCEKFDWNAATEEDDEVMNKIYAFIEGEKV